MYCCKNGFDVTHTSGVPGVERLGRAGFCKFMELLYFGSLQVLKISIFKL
jgi:hypothetical protein